jgi:hypothetical protein
MEFILPQKGARSAKEKIAFIARLLEGQPCPRVRRAGRPTRGQGYPRSARIVAVRDTDGSAVDDQPHLDLCRICAVILLCDHERNADITIL